jgi:phosphohistidine phosphatase SixA
MLRLLRTAIFGVLVSGLAFTALAPAQSFDEFGQALVVGDAPAGAWRLRPAPGGAMRRALSLMILGEGPTACFAAAPALSAARIAVLPASEIKDAASFGAPLRSYRLGYAPRQGRHVLVARGAHCRRAVQIVAAWPYEFRGLALIDAPKDLEVTDPRLRRVRNFQLLADAALLQSWTRVSSATRGRSLAADRISAEELAWLAGNPASIGGVDDTLDNFHRAAAIGDEASYFPLFSEDAVFLGTDATERWTKAAFEAFARPYFRRDSAWIFVPQSRAVTLSPEGNFAWFDETLGSRSYGECRGSGVLKKVDGSWRVAQYNLGVPVPNALLTEVVAEIRRREIDAERPPATTVILVRHAEKVSESRDPDLSARGQERARQLARQLAGLAPAALYATEYKRTQQTLAPLAKQLGVRCQVHPGRDSAGLAQKIRDEHAGQVVVVAGHSNTVPAIAAALGAPAGSFRKKTAYDDLVLISLDDRGVRCLPLSQGMTPAVAPKSRPSSQPASRPARKASSGSTSRPKLPSKAAGNL